MSNKDEEKERKKNVVDGRKLGRQTIDNTKMDPTRDLVFKLLE
jgi:hypothetical protein